MSDLDVTVLSLERNYQDMTQPAQFRDKNLHQMWLSTINHSDQKAHIVTKFKDWLKKNCKEYTGCEEIGKNSGIQHYHIIFKTHQRMRYA